MKIFVTVFSFVFSLLGVALLLAIIGAAITPVVPTAWAIVWHLLHLTLATLAGLSSARSAWRLACRRKDNSVENGNLFRAG